MNYLDDEEDKKIKDESSQDDDSKYVVEEEKLRTVFSDRKIKVDEEDSPAPQQKEDYIAKPQILEEATDGVSPITISKEMRTSFLEYAMSVIVARALPDSRDGLKPVHRRILYSMFEQGITSSVAHKKSARIVGDVLGKYHPHGDSAVYEAMVRMAQDFSMRYPLVDGHGNFGSIDGDGAAAMRYTEARMSRIANLMTESMKKETVDMTDNYDGSEKEPVVLPARFPNLLISGATGIAVGMATSIPPHNMKDTINAVIALAQNPEISIEELMDLIIAPDFPTGGLLLGRSGVIQAYTTGKGYVTIRSKSHIEELKNGKTRIIITEIPYMVNKAMMIEKIAELVKDKIVEGITDLRDESSMKGIRVVIELKRDVVPEVVRNKLFKLTQLQTKFTINFLSLVKGQPKVLGLKPMLEEFLLFQEEIITRRSRFDLDKAEARAHILEGLKIAITNIDEVIAIVRKSKTDQEAFDSLQSKFNLSLEQAKAIVDMRLGRLTGLAIEKMNEEINELVKEITFLKNILDNKNVLTDVIIKELTEIKDKFGDERRSELLHVEENIADEDLIPVKDIAITMSNKGYVKRVALEEFAVQHRGGVGVKSMNTYEDDQVYKIVVTTTHTDVLILTDKAKVYRIRAHQIPELSKQAKGIPFLNIIDIEKDERVISILTTNDYSKDKYLFTVTENGIVKKTALSEYSRINKNGKIALGMKEGDMLRAALIVDNDDEIIIGGSTGKVIRFNASETRPMGRTAAGVIGMKFDNVKGKHSVVGASMSSQGSFIFSLGDNGYGKMTPIDDYRKTKRGAKGVTTINDEKAGKLVYVRVVKGTEDMLVTTKDGVTIRTSLMEVSNFGRNSKGVKIITLKDDNLIKSVAIIDTQEIEAQVDEAIRKTQEMDISQLKQLMEDTKVEYDHDSTLGESLDVEDDDVEEEN